MYPLLILSSLSLLGIITMVGRKLALIRNGYTVKISHFHPFVLDLEKIKYLTFKNTKKFGYKSLFASVKFFVKFSNFIKIKSKVFMRKFQNNNSLDKVANKKEVSKYLKIISEYRYKIREMKDKIKEEEGIK